MSDKVKIIIELPKWEYEQACKFKDRDFYAIKVKAIQNGIPLDDVKARIEKQVERDFAFGKTEILKVPCHYGIANGLQNAILILDNIGKAGSEDDNAEET